MIIAQITDTHIVPEGCNWLSQPATQTSERLSHVIDFLNRLSPAPDVVLLTGDATDHGNVEEYAHFIELVQPLKLPLFVIPGNHDKRENMRKAFHHCTYMPPEGFIQYVIDDFPLRLIGLDTLVPENAFGLVCDKRLDWISKKFMEDKQKPTLIFMHHPPATIGYKVFDSLKCRASEDFEKLIQAQENLVGIIAGHCHRLHIASYGKKSCFISPSVSPAHYFAHPQDDFVTALELQDPSIALHHWNGSSLTTQVVTLNQNPYRIDWSLIERQKRSSLAC